MLFLVNDELEKMAASSALAASEIARALDGVTHTAENHAEALTHILTALEQVKEMELRYQSLALAVRQFALLPTGTSKDVHQEIWQSSGLSQDHELNAQGSKSDPESQQ